MLPLLLLALLPSALAQTFTDCNPLNKTCPADQALGVKNYTIDFTKSTPSDKVWNTTSGHVVYSDDGAEFTINQKGDSPTMQSNFYIMFGVVEVIFKAASGQGVISSSVLESNDRDEIDWEWVGSDQSHIQTNYFGKGDNSTDKTREQTIDIDTPMSDFHNYTVDWNQDRLQWIYDGNVIRTLNYTDAKNGTRYPQTPMNVRLGIWAGGDPDEPEGTIEWAGGPINYKGGPYTMTVKSVRVSDASNATSYLYGDTSGSWQSIKLLHDQAANAPGPISLDGDNSGTKSGTGANTTSQGAQNAAQQAASKFNSLSPTAKIAIGGGSAGAAFLGLSVLAFCCVKQRKAGKKERIAADREYEKQTAELLQWRNQLHRQRTEQMASGGGPHMGGVVGHLKRLSQSIGFNKGGYQGEYQRF